MESRTRLSEPIRRRTFLIRTGGFVGATFTIGLLGACSVDTIGSTAPAGASSAPAGGTSVPSEIASPSAKNLGTVRTQFNYIKNVENGGWFIADKLGYYQSEGIESAPFFSGAEVQVEPILVAGGAEIGQPSFVSRMIFAVMEGADLVLIGAQYQVNPIGILSLAEKPIKTPEDLIGKRIGLQEGTAIDINGLLKLNGLPNDYQEVKVGYDPEPLIRGDVDAYYAFVINQPLTLKLKNIPYHFVSLSEWGFEDYGNIVVVTRKYLTEHRDAVVAYMRATIKGWEKNEQDPALAVKLTLEEYGSDLGLDAEQQELQNQAQIPLMRAGVAKDKGLFWFDKKVIEDSTFKALQAQGRTNLPDIDKLVDLSVLEDAYQGKTSILNG